MERRAFKMQLHRGYEEEYKRRHDALWPELRELLKVNGIHDYAIYLDESTNTLFAVMQIENASRLETMREHPVMKKWWSYMRDIMDTNADHSPVSLPLKEVFHLP